MAAQLVVDIVTDASKAVTGFKKVDAAAANTGSKTQSAGSKIAGFAKVVGGAFAVEKVAEFGKASVEAAQDAAVANKRLVSVFKGAGDASGEAAKHAEEFAESLGKHTGIDPEVIKGGEAILATFHSISGETGRTAGIFDRATAAAADLAAAGFGDLKSNSVQLGKALEDPVKGLTALGKSGVTFTEQQKDTIKGLLGVGSASKAAASANIAYAKASEAVIKAHDHLIVVQQEVTSGQLKGKSAANALRIAHAALAEKTLLAAQAHAKLGDAQNKGLTPTQRANNLLKAQRIVLGAVEGQVKGTAASTATTAQKMSVAWKEAQENIGAALLPAVQKAQTAISGIFNFVSANSSWLLPMVAGITGLVLGIKAITIGMKLWGDAIKVAQGIQKAWTAATKIATGVQAAFDAVLDANPVVLIILAIIALIAGIVLLVVKVKVVREAMLEAWHAVSAAASIAFKAVLAAIHWVWDWLKSNWPYLLGILLGPFGLAAAAIYKHWADIRAGASAVLGWLRSTWATVYGIVTGPFVRAIGWIRGAWDSLVGFMEGIPGAIGRALAGVFNAIVHPFQTAFYWIRDNILGPLRSVWNTVANTINAVHIKTPGVKVLGHTVVPSFDWRPPFHIPTLASGGVFNKATLAVVGEAGREVVAPEALLRSIVGGGSQQVNVTLNVYVPPTANPAETGRAVADSLRSFFRAGGRLAVPG